MPFARRCDPGGAQPEVEGAGKAMEDEGAGVEGTDGEKVPDHAPLVVEGAEKAMDAHSAHQCRGSSPKVGVALYATAASRLRAPKLEALPAFHVNCPSLTPAGVVCSSLRRAAAG